MEIPEEVKIFLVEGYENLDKVEALLLSLEKSPTDTALLHSIFRAIHTIKGNAGFLGFTNLGGLCHTAETVLDRARNGKIVADGNLITVLLSTIDTVRSLLSSIEEHGIDSGIDTKVSLGQLGGWLGGGK